MWRKGNPPALLLGMLIGTATVKTVWRFLKKKQLRIELPYDPAILFMCIYPKKTYFEKIHTSQCYCSTIYNNQGVEETYMSIYRGIWIRKRWYMYTMKYYLAIKKKNVAIFSNMDGPIYGLTHCVCVCLCVCVLSHSFMSHSVTTRTAVSQAPLSIGILQGRIPEWVALPLSRGSSQPRDQIQVSGIVSGFFYHLSHREAHEYWSGYPIPSPGED